MKVSSSMLGLQRLTHVTSALSNAHGSSVSESADSRRWKKMEEALQQLNALPTPEQSAKDAAKARIAMLKQRLEELKAMLLHASPAQAKALAAVLKSIGSQLASVAQSVGASSGGQTPVAGVAQLNASVTAAATSSTTSAHATTTQDVTTTQVGVSASTAADSLVDQDKSDPSTGKSGQTDIAKQDQGVRAAKAADDDKSLRDLLREAKKLLKEVANMLRAKLAERDKEGKADVAAAERAMARVDDASATTSAGIAVYTALGSLDTGAVDVAVVDGVTVDTLA